MAFNNPTNVAENLLKHQFAVTQLPVCPFSIADRSNIHVEAMPSSKGGVSGMLLRVNNEFAICYATHINNEGFQRFSIAHELGHYFLPGHPDKIFQNGQHLSKAGFVSDSLMEKEADQFAASLLMPNYLFDPALDNVKLGLSGVKSLAGLCNTSLEATANRCIQRTSDPAAMVISSGQCIEYAFLSDGLKEYPKISWLKKGNPLPSSSMAYQMTQKGCEWDDQAEGTSEFQDWFDGPVQGEVFEESINLGNYGKTLTIITAYDLPTVDELEEDADLLESWTPRFKR